MSDQLITEATYLHNTQQTQETNIHAFGGIQTRDPSYQLLQNYTLDHFATRTG
jgi:hypothetical protein